MTAAQGMVLGNWLGAANGVVTRRVVLPITPALLGAAASVQAACLDPAANALGLVTSNAIDIETHD